MFLFGPHRTQGELTVSDTVGLVVEYAPATGETRVRFPDGVACLQMTRPLFLHSVYNNFDHLADFSVQLVVFVCYAYVSS